MRETPLILIVDDEDDFLEIMSMKLKSVGFEVATAKNSTEALRQAETLRPDLTLMDIQLGAERGSDIALAIRGDDKASSLKIAFLSSLKKPWPALVGEREDLSREMGMEDFLDKGDDIDVNVEKIKTLLGIAVPKPVAAAPPPPTSRLQS